MRMFSSKIVKVRVRVRVRVRVGAWMSQCREQSQVGRFTPVIFTPVRVRVRVRVRPDASQRNT